MLTSNARTALVVALLAVLPAAAPARADAGPSGQFQPSREDRDGDGLRDASDCAADDPSRPSRSGTDADCDGTPDDGGAVAVGISGPADSGPSVDAASRPSTGTTATQAVARDAAGEAVVLVRHLLLGRSVAIYRLKRVHRTAALVFAAKDNSGVTVTPTLVFAGGRERKLADRARSLSRGRAWVLRVHLTRAQRHARRVRFSIAVVDAEGNAYSATRTVGLAP